MDEEHDLVLLALPGADVVWGERTANDRAVLRSIPEPASGFHWLDEVRVISAELADIAVDDVGYPVLPAPELVETSGIPTTLAEIACTDASDLALLVQEFTAQGSRCEDWTEDIRVVCTGCMGSAEPDPDHHHRSGGWFERHHLAIAGTASDAETTLRSWIDRAPERRALLQIDEAP